MRPRLVIAIDGPSGAGKSTVARAVAQRLGYSYIETGAMYRAVALLALESSTDLDDGPALGRLAGTADIRFVPGEGHDAPQKVILNGRDVSEKLRAPEVTRAASVVSTKSQVRQRLVELQRALGKEGGVVMEGRDIGTKVFPDAEVKIF